MKNTTFLLILATYYFIGGCFGLFFANDTLGSFGATNIDKVHIATMQYLGQTNLGLALIAFLLNKTNHLPSMKAFFWGAAFFAFSAEIIGFYHINVMGISSSTTSWVDTAVRLVIGIAALYFAMRKSES